MTRSFPFPLLVLLFVQAFRIGSCQPSSFCINSLSQLSCPDFQTFDAVDIKAYSGRWYEIGSNAFFKNLQEAGGVCVSAVYTPTNGSVKVFNSQTRVIGSLPVSLVQRISLQTSEICQQARQICSEIHTGTISEGLYIVQEAAKNVSQSNPEQSSMLLESSKRIGTALLEMDYGLDALSQNVSQIQLLNSKLSQAVGAAADQVAELTAFAGHIHTGVVDSVSAKLLVIKQIRENITAIAGKLYGSESPETKEAAQQLFRAVSLIQAAETSVPGPAASIQATLKGTTSTAASFAYDTSRPGNFVTIEGQAFQNATFPGKLAVTFNDVDRPPAPYWILALEGEASTGYDAALVYGCSALPTGGTYQPLFILSRKPTLGQGVVDRFMNLAMERGINQDCHEVFAFSELPENCEYPQAPQ